MNIVVLCTKVFNKFLGNGGWSSKKAMGMYLIFVGSQCGVISLFVDVNNAEFVVSFLVGSGLGCFINDSVNKKIKTKSLSDKPK